MLVSLIENWKVPIGHFFIHGLSEAERASLVHQCLIKCYHTGVVVSSITYDGPTCNFVMTETVGATITSPAVNNSFPYPADQTKNVYIILDACHMFKLMRNCIGSYKT